MYKLIASARVERDLKKLKIEHQKALISALEDIKEEPFLGKPLTRELTGKFSYRVGVFRIIYKVNSKDKMVRVISAGHRSVIYN